MSARALIRTCFCTVVLMGYLSVKTIVKHLQGEKVDNRIDTGVVLVTPKNMDEPDVNALLHPPLDQYLK